MMKQSFYLFVKLPEKQSEQQPENCKKTRRIWKMLAALSVVLLFIGGCGSRSFVMSGSTQVSEVWEQEASAQTDSGENERNDEWIGTVSEADSEDIYIHICGAVERPGVYRIEAGSRLYEVILAAGGLSADADDSYINQAASLSDGMQIYIPTKEETRQVSFLDGPQAALSEEESPDTGLVNLNTAGVAELCTLPGIGETRAQAIIAYREKNGAFQSIEELKKVSGIKDGIYERIKDSIRV